MSARIDRIKPLATPRMLLLIAVLVVAWCGLWEAFSIANVLSGIIVAVIALVIAGASPAGHAVHFGALFQLVWLVLVDLVRSTAQVVWEILTPVDYTDEIIIGIDTRADSSAHLLLLTVSITLTPGTAIVDINVDTGRLYLHLLHADAAPQVTKHVERLAELACRSFPTADLGTDSPSDPATDPASDPVAVPNSEPLVDGEDTAT
ncbi:MAG: multicomponent Na+:H+ antiporter subunit E [Ilumatobacter sp.]|jgi:multicomponent Na+:H+ antiporter subunit E|tara:strand:- start:1010 stop:1624 length:615 start_codon:yes stop_codon:yes gene_type:complete